MLYVFVPQSGITGCSVYPWKAKEHIDWNIMIKTIKWITLSDLFLKWKKKCQYSNVLKKYILIPIE